MKKQTFIGTSGWHYKHWKNNFYPQKITPQNWLEYYASFFNTVEINKTFYSLPSKKEVKNWYEKTPNKFIFSVKLNRYITHIKKLNISKENIDKFFDNISLLKSKLGIILIQLPPSLKYNKDKLDKFLKIIPKNYNYAIELRNKTWLNNEAYEILRKNNITFCINDFPGIKTDTIKTSNSTYIRFHGWKKLYGGIYPAEFLKKWVQFIKAQNFEKVYIYFNNDENANAVKNAFEMKENLKSIDCL